MTGKGCAKGKVIQFTPRDKSKLKKLDYVDPAKKELKKRRRQQKRETMGINKAAKNIGLFIGVCIVIYLLKAYL